MVVVSDRRCIRSLRAADDSEFLCREKADKLMERIFDVAVLIVVVAIVIAVVTHAESATIINSLGTAFSNSIKSALGNS